MVVETLQPDTAPLWLSFFIWMAYGWTYILFGFVPAFYVAVVKLFGMPLLQRWASEVVIIVYPTKVKFGKITQQLEPYFRRGKGVYWITESLKPNSVSGLAPKYQEQLEILKTKYEKISQKQVINDGEQKILDKLRHQEKAILKKKLTVAPVNHIQIFSHAINQSINDQEKREAKVSEILNCAAVPPKLSGHGIWLMQNPKLHFHRHYQLIVDKNNIEYTLVPVKERQQFSIGFWHSLGIVMEKEVEVEDSQEVEVSGGASSGKRLVQTLVTTQVIIQQMKHVQNFQNFSASKAYTILKRRAKIEGKFMVWIKGEIDPMIIILLGGAVAVVAAIFMLFHGSTPQTPEAPGAPHPIL